MGVSSSGVAKNHVCECVVRYVIPELVELRLSSFPLAHADRTDWVYQQFMSSTHGLSHDMNSINVTAKCMRWFDGMVPGKEAEHLQGCVLFAGRQTMFYLALHGTGRLSSRTAGLYLST